MSLSAGSPSEQGAGQLAGPESEGATGCALVAPGGRCAGSPHLATQGACCCPFLPFAACLSSLALPTCLLPTCFYQPTPASSLPCHLHCLGSLFVSILPSDLSRLSRLPESPAICKCVCKPLLSNSNCYTQQLSCAVKDACGVPPAVQ